MKKRKTFIAMALVVAVLVLGVGYAAINNINLTVNGTGNVTANSDFTVAFDKAHTVVVTNGAAGTYTNDLTATMTVSLDSTNTVQTAVYKIDNKSAELSANLEATVSNVDTDLDKYVNVTTALYSDAECTTVLSGPVAKNETAYLKVTASLEKNPSQDVNNKTFTITVTASPVDAN